MKVNGKEVPDELVQSIIDTLTDEACEDDSEDKCCDCDDCECEEDTRINDEIVQNIVAASDWLDPDSFEKGVVEVSELCGKIAALAAVGIDPVQALNYFGSVMENEYAIKNNTLVAEKNGATQVKCAELGAAMQMS